MSEARVADTSGDQPASEGCPALPRDVLDLVSDGIVVLDADDRIRHINRPGVRMIGLHQPAHALVGAVVWDAFAQATDEFRRACALAREDGTDVSRVEHNAPWDRWLEYRVHPLPDHGLLVLVQDVTERRRVESRADEQLRQSEERFRTLVEMGSEVIALFDDRWHLRYASPAYERMTGYTIEESAHIDHLTMIHPDDLPKVEQTILNGYEQPGAPVVTTYRFRRKDGGWRTVSAVGRDLRHVESMRGFLVNARDVTEQIHLEEQLRQSQKMEALGQLAGGVAHDFNNILAAITGFAELLRADLEPDDPRQEFAGEILRAGSRAARVTRQLLAFSRRQALSIEVLDVLTVVQELGRMLRPLLPASIRLELPAAGAPLYVRADRVQLEQVLMNLTVNARDAMPEGGVLSIDARRRDTPGGALAVIMVRDTGTGMTEHTLRHLFEPFFTTKPPGRGTGLGLPTVYGIVRQLGGTIDVESAPGRGSTFTIVLSITTDAQRDQAVAREAPLQHSARRLIVVVEDEEQVRQLVVRMLERANYEVRTARNGADALELLESGVRPSLVLSDSSMPVMGGRELAARLAERRPGLPVVLMSGLLEGGMPNGAAEPSDWLRDAAGFVEKPFTMAQLLGAITRALGD